MFNFLHDFSTTLAPLGELHPAIIHFPIALIVTALVFDVVGYFSRRPDFDRFAILLLGLGTASTLPALVSGLGASHRFPVDDFYVQAHMTAALSFSVASAAYSIYRCYCSASMMTRLSAALVLVLLSTVVGEFGTVLSRGFGLSIRRTEFSSKEKPQPEPEVATASPAELETFLRTRVSIADVEAIFVRYSCYECHGEVFTTQGYPDGLSKELAADPFSDEEPITMLPRDASGKPTQFEASPFYQTVIRDNTMPPERDGIPVGMTHAERLALLEWLKNDAPLK